MKDFTYKILLRPEPEGGFTVLVPSLSGCITYGETVEESIKMAKEAISLYLEELQDRGEEIPEEQSMFKYNLKIAV
ncbi:MAG: type II toxin-antitoxin system HicB family antitoxin [Candidatus Caenarcaniphilales bacterium]|nr:type II toxin-antitoxin system HicB family antitoxin [Candidatus Caenarcaniphilales bacterium]